MHIFGFSLSDLQKAHAKHRSEKYLQSRTDIRPPAGKIWIILGGAIYHTNGALDTIIDISWQPGQDADGIMAQRICCIPAAHVNGGYPFPNTDCQQTNATPLAIATIPTSQLTIMRHDQVLVITSNATTARFALSMIEMDAIL